MQNIPEIINQSIDVLASKFGATGTHLWGILVKQSIIQGWINAALVIIFIIILILSIIALKKAWKLEREGKYSEESKTIILYIFRAIRIVTAIIVILTSSTTAIKQLSNPEYRAIQTILNPNTVN